MADNTGLPQVLLKIDGASAPTDFMADVAEIVVDTTLAAPDMVMVRVWDDPTTLRWINDATFDLGKSISVSVGGKALITAEITSLEPLIDASNGASYIVRGYDRANRLRLGKKSRTFLNKSDSDLASQLASDAGMSAQVDSTSVVYPFLLQYNQTDMEFLAERAARIGYQVSADDKTLLFKNAANEVSTTEVAELAYAIDLQQFRPRISVARQVAKATVTGWDPKEKQPIAGEASAAAQWSQIGYGKQGTAAAIDSSAAAAVVDAPVISKAEADTIAKAMLSDMTAEFIEAEGVCAGNPAIKAGKVIKIKGVGTRFSGKYFVTASLHSFTPDGGYLTHFRVTGRQPDTVSHLVGANGDAHRSRIYGVVIGVVTNLRDPDNLGRIKVKYPWLNQEVESDWLRVATLSAGNGMGIMFLPEVNDEVLIAFEHGDPTRPFMLGALWNGKDAPPLQNSAAAPNGKVEKRVIRSRTGHQIILDDSDNTPSITIIDKSGKNKVVIDAQNNKIEVTAEADVNITAKGNMKFESTGDISIESKGNFSLKSSGNLSMNATGNGTFEATGQLGVKGSSSLSLESPSKAELKSSGMVSVSSSGITEVKGSLVKIN